MKANGLAGWGRTAAALRWVLCAAACSGGGGSSEPSLVGIWTGTYRATIGIGPQPYQWVVFPSGDVLVREGAGLATRAAGTLTRSGETLLVSYMVGADGFNAVGTLDGDALGGTWGRGASSTDGGAFSVGRSAAAPCGIWVVQTGDLGGGASFLLFPGGEAEVDFGDASEVSLAHPVGGQWELNGTVLTMTFQSSNPETLDVDAQLEGDALSGTLGVLGVPSSYQPFTARLLR